MATATLTTIRDTVRLRGDYPRSAKFTDAYVNGEIQAAWSELYEIIADTNEGWWDVSSTVTTVASQAYIALPSDTWRVSGVDILDGTAGAAGGSYSTLAVVTIADRNRFRAESAKPIAYRLSSRGLELYPTPNTSYTLRVTYTPMVSALTDTPTQLYNSWEEYVVAGALYRLHQREERPVGEILNELARCRERVSTSADQRQQQSPQVLALFDDFPAGWEPF